MATQKTIMTRPATLGVLIGLAVVLGALNVGFVSLWGAKLYCGPRIVTLPQPETKRPFWKRKRKVSATQQPEPSLFCHYSWTALDRLPLWISALANDEEPPVAVEEESCNEDEHKNPLRKIVSLFKKNKSSTPSTSSPELQVAFSKDLSPTKSELKLMHQLANDFRECMNETHHDLDERLNRVSWGGSTSTKWWLGHDGAPLLASYLRIMNWPEDLQTKFPFKLCGKGCPATFAIQHTLQWRESYKPWLMSPGAIYENRNGIVYLRGYSHSLKKNDSGGHAMVWIRAGAHAGVVDPPLYFRAVLHTLDAAVSDTLHRSHQKVGKFNVVIDAEGASFQMLPKLGDAKKAIVMLQDHFPNRLGIVVLANFSKVAEFLLTMIKPLITKEVRDKILILPKDARKRQEILEAIVEKQFIPVSLGGQDAYEFNAKEYYSDSRMQFSDQEAKAYLQETPHHA